VKYVFIRVNRLNLVLDLKYFWLVLNLIHLIFGNWSLLIRSDDYICLYMSPHNGHLHGSCRCILCDH